jgi:carboxyl-terminal processing protease
VADKFLPASKRIVYTRGRLPDSNEDYYSTGRGKHADYPLIVLVDHGSASASEIVSGAMQDWDRGLVVGVTTFGKGLVQRQYTLKNGAALLLTVARYYTPSGRLIQRDYSDREKYLTEEAGQIEKEAESDSAKAARPEFHTSAGRVVYGGGGVTPDVKIDERYPYSKTQMDLDTKRAYFDFANHYEATSGVKYPSFNAFEKDFQVDDTVLRDFTDFLKEKKIDVSADSLKSQSEMVKRMIKAEVARNLWGENERYEVIIQADPTLQSALTHFPEADALERSAAAAASRTTGTDEKSRQQ